MDTLYYTKTVRRLPKITEEQKDSIRRMLWINVYLTGNPKSLWIIFNILR